MSYAAKLLVIDIAPRIAGTKPTRFTEQELKAMQYSLASQLIAGTIDISLF